MLWSSIPTTHSWNEGWGIGLGLMTASPLNSPLLRHGCTGTPSISLGFVSVSAVFIWQKKRITTVNNLFFKNCAFCFVPKKSSWSWNFLSCETQFLLLFCSLFFVFRALIHLGIYFCLQCEHISHLTLHCYIPMHVLLVIFTLWALVGACEPAPK